VGTHRERIFVLEKDVSQQQGRIAENLADVIKAVQQHRMSGELRAKREDDMNGEFGSILFIDGQAVYAQVGSYQGAAAFETLRTWKNCIFIFNTRPGNSPYLSPSSSSTLPTSIAQSSPAWTRPNTQPLALSPKNTIPLPEQEQQKGDISAIPIPLITVPRATMSVVKAIGAINKAGFPRTYRQIFLLIDGQHTISDLISLSNLSHEEVLHILRKLERLAVIILPQP
jgi:hypothetical protein